MVFTLGPQREPLHTRREAPVVHNLALSSLPRSLLSKCAFLLCDLASLLSIFSLFPLVLKQAVYCVCSAEQPALKAGCVCMCVCPGQPVRPC